MLTIEQALQARRVLDKWAAKRGEPLTPYEAHAVDAVLRSPVGKRAATDLATVLWLMRDLMRMANETKFHALTEEKAEVVVTKMTEDREARGEHVLAVRKETWRALLRSAIGSACAETIRLDAVTNELFAIGTKPKRGAA